MKKIIADGMLFVCGMTCGKCIFNTVELWKAVVIGAAAFAILWTVWDGITESQKHRTRNQKREEKAA